MPRPKTAPWDHMLPSLRNTSVYNCIRNPEGYTPVIPNCSPCPEAEKIQQDHMAWPDRPAYNIHACDKHCAGFISFLDSNQVLQAV